VSSQHALIRWIGSGWQVADRASLNGTRVEGRLLERGRFYELEEGAVVSFGDRNERWCLCDATEPLPFVTCLDSGLTINGCSGVITLPTAENPRCALYRAPDGTWRIEDADGRTRAILDGEHFHVGAKRYGFHCPTSLGATYAACASEFTGTLQFAVSKDEEYVELSLCFEDRIVSLGCRAHNYLLLLLARARQADEAANLAAQECGWMYKAQLAEALRVTPQQVDGDVFRIRGHFGQHGVAQSSNIIERRPRTTQLRLGMSKTRIKTS
jgi:hypothetical protein